MGLAKEWQHTQEARGWFSTPDRWVCERCIEEDHLARVVREQATHSVCSYCDRREARLIAAELDVIVETVCDGLHTEYGNPNDEGVPWDEGEWALGRVTGSWNLLGGLGVGSNTDLLAAIVDALVDDEWCQRHFYRLPEHQALWFGWTDFVESTRGRTVVSADDPDYISPEQLFDILAKLVGEVGLIRPLHQGTILYRARRHEPGEIVPSAESLGPPPPEAAVEGRMNRAGQAFFYGAYDSSTAIAEVARGMPTGGTVGRWRLLEDVEFIDLADLPSVPSIFDPASRSTRAALRFLHAFVEAVREPADGDPAHYRPTQIVTERLQSVGSPDPIAGIAYRSAETSDGACVTLFIDASRVDPESHDALLVLEDHDAFQV